MEINESSLKESFGTLSETINGLIRLGYTHDFNIQEECLVCKQFGVTLSPDDFQIDKVYRFEGASNPEDQSVLYAISSKKFNIKGTLVNGYGISSEETASKLVEKLQTNKTHFVAKDKSNVAKSRQLEGDRLLNGQFVEMDLYEFINQIKRESAWSDSDRNAITIFKSESMRIVLMGLHENAELKAHKANGVISVQVMEGKIKFVTEQQVAELNKGQIIALQENIVHSVTAITESFFLLTLAMKKK